MDGFRKYSGIGGSYHLLRSLTFFDDASRGHADRESIPWGEIKAFSRPTTRLFHDL
jgi:hypothetical protein